MKKGIAENWVVVTNSQSKADLIFLILETAHSENIVRRTEHENNSLRLTQWADGDRLVWIRPYQAHGMRADKIWIDREIESGLLNEVILPMHMGSPEDIIWI